MFTAANSAARRAPRQSIAEGAAAAAGARPVRGTVAAADWPAAARRRGRERDAAKTIEAAQY